MVADLTCVRATKDQKTYKIHTFFDEDVQVPTTVKSNCLEITQQMVLILSL